jgi:hypothetical protein
VLEDEGAAAAACGLDGAHQAGGAGSEDKDVDFGHTVYCQRRDRSIVQRG